MNLSLIICTYQRSSDLVDVLECLLKQKVPQGFSCEILVVDNHSTDQTSDVVHDYINKFNGNLRYIYEEKKGLPFARNTGIREARGEILAFTDDDVILDPGWFVEIQKVFENKEIEAAAGKVLALWKGNKPSWYSDRLRTVVPDIDHGDTVKPIKMATGANMVFRRELIHEVGLFDDTPAEDSLFSMKVNQRHIIWYYPSLKVYHKVFPERMTPAYFRRWYSKAGRSMAIICRRGGEKNRKIFRVPVWMWQALLKDAGIFLRHAGDIKTRFWFEMQLRKFFGFCRYEWFVR